MKPAAWLAGLGLCILCSTPVAAQIEVPVADIGTVQIRSVSVSTVDTSHVELAVSLSLTPERSVTLQNVCLCSLHLNGLPVFASPLNQEIALRKGEAIAFPAIYISVFFRDLATLHPLHEMIEKQSVHVQGELVSGLQLGLLGKLALHSEHPRIIMPLNQDVPVEIGGTPLERSFALGILSALESQMAGDSTAGKLMDGLRPEWIRNLETQAQSNLFVAQSSYSVADGKATYPVDVEALGFRVASGKIATSAEMVSPWKYDAEFLGALSSGSVKMVKGSQELRLALVTGIGPPLLLSAADFTVDLRGTGTKDKLTPLGETRSQVEVLRRASPSSLAILALRTTASGGFTNAPESVRNLDHWDNVVVFRLRTGANGTSRIFEPLQIAARRDGEVIRLTQPVDQAVFGSPIVAPEGVIGLVQDESTGTFLPTDLW